MKTITDSATIYILSLFPALSPDTVRSSVAEFCRDHRVLQENNPEVVAHNIIAGQIVFDAGYPLADHARSAGYNAGITPRGYLFLSLPCGTIYELTHD